MSIINRNNISKTIQYFKKNGISDTVYAARERIALKRKSDYSYISPSIETLEMQKYYSLNYDLSGVCGDECRPVPQGIEDKPRITIVMPAYETPTRFLKAAIDSVVAQSYPRWELIVADASESTIVQDAISEYDSVYETDLDAEHNNSRSFIAGSIVYTQLKHNLGISENTNAAISLACGDYIALMDHDDVFTPDALFRLAAAAEGAVCDGGRQVKNPVLIYSDEDKTDSEGTNFYDPHIKYDFNYDYLLTNNYICHLSCIRRDIFDTIQFRREYDGAQDYDLVLQIAEKLINDGSGLSESIVHIPRVLYHWRCHEASTAANTSSKLYAYEAGLKAIQNHVDNLYGNQNLNAEGKSPISVEHSKHLGFYKITYGCNGVFGLRDDVGAVIERHFDIKGRMLPIIWNEKGDLLYAGINKHFAGELNRFDCSQDVAVADIRYLTINPDISDKYVEFLGTAENMKREGVKDNEAWYDLSRKLCMKMREDGYKILYIPQTQNG